MKKCTHPSHLSNLSIPKIPAVNLHQNKFSWLSEKSCELMLAEYAENLEPRQSFNLFQAPYLKKKLCTQSHDNASHFFLLQVQPPKAHGFAEIQFYFGHFTLAWVFARFDKHLPQETLTAAYTYLISATFLMSNASSIHTFQHEVFQRVLPNIRVKNILSFKKSGQNFQPVTSEIVILDRGLWFGEGPGKRHKASLLYLTPE